MADDNIPKTTKLYFVTGWTFWFVFRWAIYIGLFIIMFRLGGLQGTLKERFQQLRPPKVQVVFPQNTPLPAPPPGPDIQFGYYTVVVSTTPTRAAAAQVQSQLRDSRTQSEIVAEGGFYSVTVGRYSSLNDANETLAKVVAHGFLSARVAGKQN